METPAETNNQASVEASPVQGEDTAEPDTTKPKASETSTEENSSPVRKSNRTPKKTRKAMESYDDTLQQQPPRKLARTESSPVGSVANPPVAEGKDGPANRYLCQISGSFLSQIPTND